MKTAVMLQKSSSSDPRHTNCKQVQNLSKVNKGFNEDSIIMLLLGAMAEPAKGYGSGKS